MRAIYLVWLAASFANVAIPTLAFAEGGTSGGGGDIYAQEFVSIGYQMVGHLAANPVAGIPVQKLSEALQKIRVHSEPTLELNGYSVDAINYPDSLPSSVVLSRTAWDELKSTPYKKDFLVVHELLGISKIDDTNYALSHQIDEAHVCSRSEDVKAAITARFHISCDRLIEQDLLQFKTLFVSGSTTAFFAGDLAGLANLTSLNLKTLAATIPDHFFSENLNLKKLWIQLPELERIQGHLFSGLDQLLVLGLSKAEKLPVGPRPPSSFQVDVDSFEGLSKNLWLYVMTQAHFETGVVLPQFAYVNLYFWNEDGSEKNPLALSDTLAKVSVLTLSSRFDTRHVPFELFSSIKLHTQFLQLINHNGEPIGTPYWNLPQFSDCSQLGDSLRCTSKLVKNEYWLRTAPNGISDVWPVDR